MDYVEWASVCFKSENQLRGMKDFDYDELSDFVRMTDERFDGDVEAQFIEWVSFNNNGWNTS
ncbi:LOW QUALITY PROTEIN: hypothetical protein ACHAWF_005403 [Thalassiosira exigua]